MTILFAKKAPRNGEIKTFVKEVSYLEDESGYSLLSESIAEIQLGSGMLSETLLALVGQKVNVIFSDYTEKNIVVGKTKFRPDDDEDRVLIYAA